MVQDQAQSSHRGLANSKCFRFLANNAPSHTALSNVLLSTELSAVAGQLHILYIKLADPISQMKEASPDFP